MAIDGLLGFDVDKMSYFLLADSDNSSESLLLGRLVPPWIDDYHSVSNGEVQRLTSALERRNLHRK